MLPPTLVLGLMVSCQQAEHASVGATGLHWSDHSSRAVQAQADTQQMVGEWSGRFSNGELGFRRTWTTNRQSDGTFEIQFQRFWNGGHLETVVETGQWWIANGLYHERMTGHDDVHLYRFMMLGADEILFEKPSSGYTFIDRRGKLRTE